MVVYPLMPNVTVKLIQSVVLSLSLLELFTLRAVANTVDPRKPYGRVCLSVVTSSGGETVFDVKGAYAASDRIEAHLDATLECTAVTLALDPVNGHLANDWRPQAVDLSEGQEMVLPQRPIVWNLASVRPFDFYVLFLDSGSSEAREIKRLIRAMQSSKTGSQLLDIQTTKLRELVTRQLAGSDLSSHAATIPLPDQVGGALRGGSDEFPWRRFSVRVNFTEIQPGMLIFSSRGPEDKK